MCKKCCAVGVQKSLNKTKNVKLAESPLKLLFKYIAQKLFCTSHNVESNIPSPLLRFIFLCKCIVQKPSQDAKIRKL